MNRHDLKTWPDAFDAIAGGRKSMEIRHNDRRFAAGDLVRLRRFDPATGQYTGEELERLIVEVTDEGAFKVQHGYVAVRYSRSAPVRAGVDKPADLAAVAAWHDAEAARERSSAETDRNHAKRYLPADVDQAEATPAHIIAFERYTTLAGLKEETADFHQGAAVAIRERLEQVV